MALVYFYFMHAFIVHITPLSVCRYLVAVAQRRREKLNAAFRTCPAPSLTLPPALSWRGALCISHLHNTLSVALQDAMVLPPTLSRCPRTQPFLEVSNMKFYRAPQLCRCLAK